MPLQNFSGDCFVAYTDISGFKLLMKSGEALHALDYLYTFGYEELLEQDDICGMFVSDCGILYTTGNNKASQLDNLLQLLKKINIRMLHKGYMLTTAIAYGDFSYHERIEFSRIRKDPLYGNAYVEAYLDNEKESPKIQPGQCRIKKKYIEDDLFQHLANRDFLRYKDGYYYFYWNLDNPRNIEEFEKLYNNSYNLKYKGMEEALKKFIK